MPAYADQDGDQPSPTLDEAIHVRHFIFNYLDYKLWRRFTGADGDPKSACVDVVAFRFRYRNSVEHFYPQHPNQDHRHESLDSGHLHAFGYLRIMTRPQNSQRSNLMPAAKIGQYHARDQSLNFQLMAEVLWHHNAEPLQDCHLELLHRNIIRGPH